MMIDRSQNKISFRICLWKLLLGEEAVFPNNRKEHSRWKERTYCDCKRLLKSSARIDDGWPLPKTLNVMWLLYDVKLNLDFNKQVKPVFWVFLKNCTHIIFVLNVHLTESCCLLVGETSRWERLWWAGAIWAFWSKMGTPTVKEFSQPPSCQ